MTLHHRLWPSNAVRADQVRRPVRGLLLLHGFTQNVDCWGEFGTRLARGFEVIAVDAPGHGRSGHDNADLWETGALVAETIERMDEGDGGLTPSTVVGYSMGGRTALHLALGWPHLVERLVLIGATAGIADAAARSARRAADESLADRLLSEPLEVFVDRWLAGPLFAGLSPEAASRGARLANRPEGLASSLRCCGTGAQESLWSRLSELTMPILLIAGTRDTKFTKLADEMAAAMSAATVERRLIEGHHAVHLERPAETANAIIDWADRWSGDLGSRAR